MTRSTLTKIGENEFRIDFETECYYRESKSVIVDGEIYTREWNRIEKINSKIEFDNAGEIVDYGHVDCVIDKLKGSDWERIVIKNFFDYNGQIYYVWNYKGFLQDPAEDLWTMYSRSTVGYVNILTCLVEGKYVKNIYKIWTDKKNSYRSKTDTYSNIIEKRQVEFCIYNYGFNNCVMINYNIYNLLNTDFSKIINSRFYRQMELYSDDYPKLFPKKMIAKKITEIDKTEIAIEILNKSINFKQQKK